ncbi:phosphoenolpyruvate hydrolase family protein [Aquibium carbonis]|uniref:phosphoenolpyruvate hydrolase family protein n=1 Tax=Aquibium carbonis TaxID=2495581 RepID=UPI001478DA27|nr:phosphoenolpyruvate hydrolase family protein [Aquibium carbonis]
MSPLVSQDLHVFARQPAVAPHGGFILAPFLAGVAAPHRELVGLLPLMDVNSAMFASLRQSAPAVGAIAGLMLADPFMRVRDVELALRAAGVGRVANYPTVQLIDGETARAFDSAEVGVAREMQMLSALRDAGVETIGFATTLQTAQTILRQGAMALVLHPGLAMADWRERADAGLRLVRMLPSLRGEGAARLLVYRPHGFGHELDEAIGLADGEARIVD